MAKSEMDKLLDDIDEKRKAKKKKKKERTPEEQELIDQHKKERIANLIKHSPMINHPDRYGVGSPTRIKAGQSVRKRTQLKSIMMELLEMKVNPSVMDEFPELRDYAEFMMDENVSELSVSQIMSIKMITEAMKGNTKAFEIVRDTSGQKPIDKVETIGANVVIDFSSINKSKEEAYKGEYEEHEEHEEYEEYEDNVDE